MFGQTSDLRTYLCRKTSFPILPILLYTSAGVSVSTLVTEAGVGTPACVPFIRNPVNLDVGRLGFKGKVAFKGAGGACLETLRLLPSRACCTVTALSLRSSRLRLSRLVPAIRLFANSKGNVLSRMASLHSTELSFESPKFAF